jgi:threonine dehydrogenase-like Zn-dependent dehydrogenase
MQGRVAAFAPAGERFTITEFPVPDPEPGAILARVAMAGICGSDLHVWRGEIKGAGVAAGHEMVGRVERLGAGVTTDSLGRPLREGDRIVYAYFYPCRRCPVCLRGQFAACPHEVARRPLGEAPYFTSAYADFYYLRPGHVVYRAPDEISDEELTPVNCALSQVVFGLQQAGLRLGDSFVTQGAGGLGLSALAVAREMGAHPLIAVDGVPGRLELARAFGADHTVDLNEYPTAEARIARVRELTGGYGADVVADFVGNAAVLAEGVAMTRNGGAYLEVGNISPEDQAAFRPQSLVSGRKRIVGVMHYNPDTIGVALDFLVRARGRYPFDRLISHRFPLDRIDEAFTTCEWMGRQADCGVVRGVIVP